MPLIHEGQAFAVEAAPDSPSLLPCLPALQALLDAISLARGLFDSELGDPAASRVEVLKCDSSGGSQPRARRRRSRRSLSSALRLYEAEASVRSARKVSASRLAATLLHSEAALNPVGPERSVTRKHAALEAVAGGRAGGGGTLGELAVGGKKSRSSAASSLHPES